MRSPQLATREPDCGKWGSCARPGQAYTARRDAAAAVADVAKPAAGRPGEIGPRACRRARCSPTGLQRPVPAAQTVRHGESGAQPAECALGEKTSSSRRPTSEHGVPPLTLPSPRASRCGQSVGQSKRGKGALQHARCSALPRVAVALQERSRGGARDPPLLVLPAPLPPARRRREAHVQMPPDSRAFGSASSAARGNRVRIGRARGATRRAAAQQQTAAADVCVHGPHIQVRTACSQQDACASCG
jgi:hypothetical protein